MSALTKNTWFFDFRRLLFFLSFLRSYRRRDRPRSPAGELLVPRRRAPLGEESAMALGLLLLLLLLLAGAALLLLPISTAFFLGDIAVRGACAPVQAGEGRGRGARAANAIHSDW